MFSPIYIALVHYPVLNKHKEIVMTSLTNFDLHDLARTSRTFEVKKCFIVTPNSSQQNMVSYLKKYWTQGFGSTYNPDRKEALGVLDSVNSIEDSCLTIKKLHGNKPLLIATTARGGDKSITFKELQVSIQESGQPLLILFGTGWGLADEVLNQADAVLEPIKGAGNYNHLPVRSAVAIVLDRLLGKKESG